MDDLARPPLSNIPEYSVADLAGAVKRLLEGEFGRVRVRGEITELKTYASGHTYFALKDEAAKLRAVIWKSAARRIALTPENGVEVVATGRLTSYPDRSEYQLMVEQLEYAGAGALLARIELLRQRLAEEGLFAEARKRRLPLLPRVVGVVSSPQGAVIQDIRTTIARRFPRPVLLWPVPVQGEGAAARIAAAIAGFGALPPGGPIPRPDVLIVARGGGSLEDLMAFNDEAVVRAAAACPIPLISAIGHETDTTLIDLAADRRAPTPTAAAELAVPARAELAADLQHSAARLSGALGRSLTDAHLRLDRAGRRIPDLPGLLGTARQRLDDRAHRLSLALPNLLHARRAALVRVERHLRPPEAALAAARTALRLAETRLAAALPNLLRTRRTALVAVERRLPPPQAALAAARTALALADTRLRGALRHAVQRRSASAGLVLARLAPQPLQGRLREARARLEGLAARLESLSHRAVLARGYAAVFDARDRPLTTAAAIAPGAALRIAFTDGDIRATADGARRDKRQTSLPI